MRRRLTEKSVKNWESSHSGPRILGKRTPASGACSVIGHDIQIPIKSRFATAQETHKAGGVEPKESVRGGLIAFSVRIGVGTNARFAQVSHTGLGPQHGEGHEVDIFARQE